MDRERSLPDGLIKQIGLQVRIDHFPSSTDACALIPVSMLPLVSAGALLLGLVHGMRGVVHDGTSNGVKTCD